MGRKEGLKSYAPAAIAAIGCLTTGPNAKAGDEALALAVADGTGEILFDELVRPERRKSWKQAETRTHISPAMVEGRKTPREQAPEIEKILSSAQLIVFYGKDVPAFLKKSGITLPQAKTFDLAHEFSEAHGVYDPATDSWKACTLEECVTYFGGKAPETTAASEAEAAAFTFRELLRNPWYGKPRTKPLKSIEAATGETFWDYGDEEGRLAGKDAASHASKEKRAEEDSEESETDRELREAERSWLKPTPAKFVILALGAIGFTVAGEPEGAAVCAFLAVFLLMPKKRR